MASTGATPSSLKRTPDARAHAGYNYDSEASLRLAELEQTCIERYPRLTSYTTPTQSLQSFRLQYESEKELEAAQESKRMITLAGRVFSVRTAGRALAFMDIVEGPGSHRLQLLLNIKEIGGVSSEDFKNALRLIRRGDVVAATGAPSRSGSGELSLLVKAMPTILSPSLHNIPVTKTINEADILERHVQMLSNPTMVNTLVLRSTIIRSMRQYFESQGFHEVQSPILAAAAGGAAARAFTTSATEFENRVLSLRIAPELWLKRLIIGGMSRIFEIGPSFRNEGLDKTHNPEFSTCEFYATYHSLSQLQRMTEQLIQTLVRRVRDEHGRLHMTQHVSSHPHELAGLERSPFHEIDFIPAINSHLSTPLPNLALASARAQVLEIFKKDCIPIPKKPTLPRLLDKLCSHFLEPICEQPTWIINIPECMSPLAKSYVHPTAPNSQHVAARAELFIRKHEIVNCYEEENSPIEQRRKFMDQQSLAKIKGSPNEDTKSSAGSTAIGTVAIEDDEAMAVDEDYLRALEWGLPPTGGWGCGIDRLVMLLIGKDRISDVLSFGNLRAVTRSAPRKGRTDGKV